MNYINAQEILPEELLCVVQQYVHGSYLYIPARPEEKRRWGERTGSKQLLQQRNDAISQAYMNGASIRSLAQQYFLTEHSIRRIVRAHKREQL
ncbi:CD3324 family protein [Paenibacillus taiwanensis]|uniref:CD3324 family protein n=1 Tax=Paenibacillus taiwanensis TaxID=401638 RepID=UPI000416D132|nr:CD3324 family protein [Paenibacillus taiwanensis]